MSSYDALAASYDGLMADGVYRRRADYLEKLFQKSMIPVHTVLDLACGTGTIACLLAAKGYAVTATDLSEEMLTQAMSKAAALEQPPLFVQQSMPRLRLPEPVDARGVHAGFPELSDPGKGYPGDLPAGIPRVEARRQLFFDVNTPYKLRRMDGQLYTDETEESYCVWRTFFSEKTNICTYQVDLFRLPGQTVHGTGTTRSTGSGRGARRN